MYFQKLNFDSQSETNGKKKKKKQKNKKTKQKICEFRIDSINTIELLNKLTVYFEKH